MLFESDTRIQYWRPLQHSQAAVLKVHSHPHSFRQLAWFQDSSCTTRSDVHLWESPAAEGTMAMNSWVAWVAFKGCGPGTGAKEVFSASAPGPMAFVTWRGSRQAKPLPAPQTGDPGLANKYRVDSLFKKGRQAAEKHLPPFAPQHLFFKVVNS